MKVYYPVDNYALYIDSNLLYTLTLSAKKNIIMHEHLMLFTANNIKPLESYTTNVKYHVIFQGCHSYSKIACWQGTN